MFANFSTCVASTTVNQLLFASVWVFEETIIVGNICCWQVFAVYTVVVIKKKQAWIRLGHEK